MSGAGNKSRRRSKRGRRASYQSRLKYRPGRMSGAGNKSRRRSKRGRGASANRRGRPLALPASRLIRAISPMPPSRRASRTGRRSRLLYRPMPGTRCRSRRQGGHRLGTGRSPPERVLASLPGRLVASIALALAFEGCSRRALTAHRRNARRINGTGTSPQPELIPAEEHARIRRPAATPAPNSTAS